VFDGPSLFRIELFKIGDGHRFRISMGMGSSINHVSCFAHNACDAAPALISARLAATQTPIDSLASIEQKGNILFPQ
jgi:hypothetical protein